MLLNENVVTIGAGARLADAANRMRTFRVNRLAVWHRGRLDRELSAADVHRAVREGTPIDEARVEHYARPRSA